jgi:hypothetical protein
MVDGRMLHFGVGDEGYGPTDEYKSLLSAEGLLGRVLGVVTSGSLTKGIEIRVSAGVPVEEMAAGRYVTIEGAHSMFFGMITDVELRSAIGQVLSSPPGAGGDGGLRGAEGLADAADGPLQRRFP